VPFEFTVPADAAVLPKAGAADDPKGFAPPKGAAVAEANVGALTPCTTLAPKPHALEFPNGFAFVAAFSLPVDGAVPNGLFVGPDPPPLKVKGTADEDAKVGMPEAKVADAPGCGVFDANELPKAGALPVSPVLNWKGILRGWAK
jgi:hypothetical protein